MEIGNLIKNKLIIPELFKNKDFVGQQFVNQEKLDKFISCRRCYMVIVGLNTHNLNSFNLERMMD